MSELKEPESEMVGDDEIMRGVPGILRCDELAIIMVQTAKNGGRLGGKMRPEGEGRGKAKT